MDPGSQKNTVQGRNGTYLQGANEQHRLEGVVHAEVQTTVHDDADAGDSETSVETGNAVGCDGLPVDVDQAVELTLSATLLGRLGVVSETGTCIIKGIHEEEGAGTSGSTRGQVAAKPLPIAIPVLLVAEQALEVILEGEVQRLRSDIENLVNLQSLLRSMCLFN